MVLLSAAMIERMRGNLLDAHAEALVNTVNTVGIMGKGIALQFKKVYPENFKAYKQACNAKTLEPGRMLTYDLGNFEGPRFIINFPTKTHWRAKSKIGDIEKGLESLIEEVKRLKIKSIAVPPLGCGNGGLEWRDVFPLIEEAFKKVPDVHVFLYEPLGRLDIELVKATEKRPKMTVARAVIISLIRRYLAACLDPFGTLLEVHKLAYFIQTSGEPLNLGFEANQYGPYADNFRHALNHLEGHYIIGIGDGRTRPDTPIQLLEGAASEAEAFLEHHTLTQERFTRVAQLIEGFETPFGMELLASVHWVATQMEPKAKYDLDAAIAGVRTWNSRKGQLFNPRHIEAAWQRLKELEWF